MGPPAQWYCLSLNRSTTTTTLAANNIQIQASTWHSVNIASHYGVRSEAQGSRKGTESLMKLGQLGMLVGNGIQTPFLFRSFYFLLNDRRKKCKDNSRSLRTLFFWISGTSVKPKLSHDNRNHSGKFKTLRDEGTQTVAMRILLQYGVEITCPSGVRLPDSGRSASLYLRPSLYGIPTTALLRTALVNGRSPSLSPRQLIHRCLGGNPYPYLWHEWDTRGCPQARRTGCLCANRRRGWFNERRIRHGRPERN